MITAVLAMVFTWCLFFGRMPQPFLIGVCVVTGLFLACVSRHKHTQALSIDALAQMSRLKNVNPVLKFWTIFILIIMCSLSKNNLTGIFLLVTMLILAVFAGGLSLHHYVHILTLPISFLLIDGLTMLFEVSPQPTGVLNIGIFGSWLSVSVLAQVRTSLIVSRAVGAVSCLCFLSVTTPISEIIGVLRQIRCPELIIDLMYLIYRYIFILLSLHYEMCDAAESRLGFMDYHTKLRTVGKIYSNLLARSFRFASKNFDAMESRCFDSGIRFLEQRNKITYIQAAVSSVIVLSCLFLSLLT